MTVDVATVPSTEVGPPTSNSVRVPSGRRITLDRFGEDGPTVLLLHGIPGWRGTYTQVGARVGQRCRVFAPDLLGFGESDDAPPDAHAAQHADSIASMAEALGLERFHLVGFDFGGPTAVELAGKTREKVQSLTLISPNLFPDTPIPAPLRIAQVPLLGRAFYRLAFSKLGLMMMWRAAVKDRAAFPFRRYRASLRPNSVRTTRRIFFASMRDLPGLYSNVATIAQKLDMPALVIWGDSDPFFPLSVAQRTAAAVNGKLAVLEGCGHFAPEERPEQVANEIFELIARIEG